MFSYFSFEGVQVNALFPIVQLQFYSKVKKSGNSPGVKGCA